MKTRLEHGDDFLELEVQGRVLFLRTPGGDEERGCFDAAAAAAAAAVLLEEKLSAGWVESAEVRQRRAAREAAAAEARERLARHEALCAAAEPAAALRSFAGQWFSSAADDFEWLLSRVTALRDPVEGGFVVCLGDARLDWITGHDEALVQLWGFVDETDVESGDHAVFFGPDAGPPEPPDEVERDWFLQDGLDTFFAEVGGAVWRYELDGGLSREDRTVAQVLAATLRARLG